MLTINDMRKSIARSHSELIRAQIALCDAQSFIKKHLPGGGQVQSASGGRPVAAEAARELPLDGAG